MAVRRIELSDAELEVLKALWDAGESTVRALHEGLANEGREWGYTTVLTFLARLEGKGYAASRKEGGANVYRPLVDRDSLLRRRLGTLADELCDGAATPLMRALVAGKRLPAEEISELRRLLDELEQSSSPGPSPKKSKRTR